MNVQKRIGRPEKTEAFYPFPMAGELVEGEDFYREGPFVVFTGSYLRRRGWCCENGCRHCPWGYAREGRGDAPEGTISEE